jgi:LysR family glycine cleavage system transcriptional activator
MPIHTLKYAVFPSHYDFYHVSKTYIMNWNDIPSLAALRAFEALARHGTMSAAAASLNVTHAAIAQHLRTLEAHLGVQLAKRAGRGMQLTADGQALATSLSEGFSVIEAGVRAITTAKADKPLSITTTPSFAENWLLPRLSQFWATHPTIMLSITPDRAVVDLRRDDYDLAIRYGTGDWPGMKSTFLVPADYVVVAAPSILKGHCPSSIADLNDLPWVFEAVHQEPQRWAVENGLDLACCQMKTFDTLNMTLSGLRAGLGVSVVSRALVERDLENGALVEVTAVPPTGVGYHIVELPDRTSAKAKVFKKWLLAAA